MELDKQNHIDVLHATFDNLTTKAQVINAALRLFFAQDDAKDQLAMQDYIQRKPRGKPRSVVESDES